jgi:A/G-specific adenine glycosylase
LPQRPKPTERRPAERSPALPSATHPSTTLPTPAWKSAFRRKLRAWFDLHRRDLPWRRTRDPYAVWISEVMLQQTQVATVVDYYRRFLARFPTIAALAAAPEQDVLRLWEGLGYYRRARQLHRAAQLIAAEHGGEFPRDPAVVRSLPGIGRYTAGAVLSIAFDLPLPILEANTVRLLSRLALVRDDPTSKTAQAALWSWAEALVPEREPGLFNQALMELGALVCTPRDPRCLICPAAALCPARNLGLQDQIPLPKARVRFENVREGAVVVRHRDQVLVVRHPEGGRWAGLWDFPRYSLDAESEPAAAHELRAKLAATLGLDVAVDGRLATLKHGVTRFRITLDVYEARRLGGRLKPAGFAEACWRRPDETAEIPLHMTARKIADFLAGGRSAD